MCMNSICESSPNHEVWFDQKAYNITMWYAFSKRHNSRSCDMDMLTTWYTPYAISGDLALTIEYTIFYVD